MASLASRRRGKVIAHAEGHADPMVQEAVRALLAEIVVLRGMLGEGPSTLTLSRRRLVGLTVAAFVLVMALASGALWATHDESALAFRQGMVDGYHASARGDRPVVESVSVLVARPALQHAAHR